MPFESTREGIGRTIAHSSADGLPLRPRPATHEDQRTLHSHSRSHGVYAFTGECREYSVEMERRKVRFLCESFDREILVDPTIDQGDHAIDPLLVALSVHAGILADKP